MMRLNNGRRFFAPALVLAALALVLVAAPACRKEGGGGAGGGNCAAQREKKDRKLVVGFSQMENNGPWRVAETASMKDEAAKRADRFELIVTDAQGNVPKQVNDVEDLVSRCVDAIFLAPREATGFEPALQAAKAAGIPVILIDREVKGTAGEDFLTFIGSDFVAEGRRAGEWLAKQTNGKAGIIELLGTAGSSVADDRHNGFAEAIKSQPDMKILASQTGDFNRAQGQRVMENLIQAHQKSITAVYAHSDEMALGAVQALKDAGRQPGKDVLVVSVDGQRTALEAITRGEMNATVECNPRFGPIAFDTLERHLRGEKLQPKITMTDRFFDQSNAAQFVAEAY
ncbi:MAG TPA: ABC transporter substrate-binding protein [Pyrinomonadaceae bacterium]|nr:ABC transporter substrate-binding protein [Pyrinomonadaceae bacterium]